MQTVNDLIRQIRFNVQESNKSQVSDQMILDALNRGKDYAYNKMAKQYLEPLLRYEDVQMSQGDTKLAIPPRAFEDRVVKLECKTGDSNRWEPITRMTFQALGPLTTNATDLVPPAWALVGRNMVFPNPVRSITVRIWYLQDLGKLVKQQGRIDAVSESVEEVPPDTPAQRPFITVDSVGEDISVSDTYKKYVSVVDSSTGEIKGSLQVEEINGDQIKFRAVPTRDKVLNIDVSGESLLDEQDVVDLDDYLCSLGGTCVVLFPKPIENYIIQYATNEIRDTLGTLKSGQSQRLDKLEDDITSSKAGREGTKTIKNTSGIWQRGRLRRNIK